jgi:hypothetical protein
MEISISILQSIISIILLLVFWLVQSIIILNVTRKYIFPVLFKNKFLEWVIVQPSVAVHEISHLLAAIFTGSFVSESFISSRAGRVTALSSESIGGWISRIIAAFAPTFQTFLVFIIIILLFPNYLPNFSLSSIFEYKEDFGEIMNEIFLTLNLFFQIVFNILQSINLTSAFILIFVFYLLVVLSLTATPSEDDWKAGLQVIFSPIPFFSVLFGFIILSVIFSYFGKSILVPLASFLAINFIIAIFGIFVSFLLSKVLSLGKF